MSSTAPVALITGAAKRIGAAIATYLHQSGYRIIIHYGESKKEADTLVKQLNSLRPDSATSLQADLCDINQVQQLASKAISHFNRLDVLINNASSFYPTPLGHISLDDWHALVGSNVQGPLFLSQAVWPVLKQHRGCIINMIDMHIDRPLPKHSVYSLAKSALASLTRSLACEMAPFVRVNGIAPGAILWPERTLSTEQQRQLIDSIPLGEMGSPNDITHAVSYLLSASYVTGQVLYVDGGRTLHTNASA